MPYVEPLLREGLDKGLTEPKLPGELNYLITRQIVRYQNKLGLSYATINDIVGALEGAKAEYYRRVVVPYENAKLAENGDVY